ncbi:MAG: FHA domain-containing protein [Candidatus Schekmanbacteria bacterium]|nr:FHA domain-containing protein [Candidatus Schekmanbacteria bacterium]
MKTLRGFPGLLTAVIAAVLVVGAVPLVSHWWSHPTGPRRVLIRDLLAQPVDYWASIVIVEGKVVDPLMLLGEQNRAITSISREDLAPRSDGISRYVITDAGGGLVSVRSPRRAALGSQVTVEAIVAQNSRNALAPSLYEIRRLTGISMITVYGASTAILLATAVALLAILTYTGFRPPDVEILVLEGPLKGHFFRCKGVAITIGRPGARENTVSLDEPTVSRTQATIQYDPRRRLFTLRNEASVNLTQLNGAAVQEAEICTGDRIVVGTSLLEFRTLSPGAPVSAYDAARAAPAAVAALLACLSGIAPSAVQAASPVRLTLLGVDLGRQPDVEVRFALSRGEQPLVGLAAEDIAFYLDDAPLLLRSLESSVMAVPAGPLAVVVLLEAQLDTRGRSFFRAREAATALMGRLADADLAALVVAGADVQIVRDLGSDRDAMLHAIRQLNPEGDSPSLAQALVKSVNLALAAPGKRRHVILIGGRSSLGGVDVRATASRLQQVSVAFSAVTTDGAPNEQVESLARLSGGRLLKWDRDTDIHALMEWLRGDQVGTYAATLQVAHGADEERHRLRLEVSWGSAVASETASYWGAPPSGLPAGRHPSKANDLSSQTAESFVHRAVLAAVVAAAILAALALRSTRLDPLRFALAGAVLMTASLLLNWLVALTGR